MGQKTLRHLRYPEILASGDVAAAMGAVGSAILVCSVQSVFFRKPGI